MLDLADKSVLVTGAASGIGRASAARFAAAGARVIVTDVTDESGKGSAAAIGGEYLHLDVADPDAWRDAAHAWRDRPQPLAVAHLNAGIRLGAPAIVDVSDAQYARILGANLSGVFYGMRVVVPLLQAAGGGAIIVTASRAALQPLPQDPCYAMTKHAVAGLVRSVADDLGRRGISVNAICPAIVDTGFLGGRRAELEAFGLVVMEPEEVAAGVFAILESGETGRCFVQEPGGKPVAYEFAPA
jgi:NAD(P)-dependent dehydrogenase (short-subunit alcohol dehydrogenase family)